MWMDIHTNLGRGGPNSMAKHPRDVTIILCLLHQETCLPQMSPACFYHYSCIARPSVTINGTMTPETGTSPAPSMLSNVACHHDGLPCRPTCCRYCQESWLQSSRHLFVLCYPHYLDTHITQQYSANAALPEIHSAPYQGATTRTTSRHLQRENTSGKPS